MISIEEAKRKIIDCAPAPRIGVRKLDEAEGLHLAEDVEAPEPMPRFSSSAMDGYAVVSPEKSDTESLPLKMTVIGESRAGVPFGGEINVGEAVAISTGALIPRGTERIIPIENIKENGSHILIHKLGESGQHIRREGEETAAGDIIARQYEKITPPMMAWLSGFGITELSIFQPPRIGIYTTGEELVDANNQIEASQIRNTNLVFLRSFLSGEGIQPVLIRNIPDSMDKTIEAIEEAVKVSDIILMTGGVSVGPHDHVKEAAESAGFVRRFWKVSQKPGKPLYFATLNGKCLFGLPGNPVAVVTTALTFVFPVIRRLMGNLYTELNTIKGRMNSDVTVNKSERAMLLLVKVDAVEGDTALLSPIEKIGSHMLSGPAAGDGFVILPEGKREVFKDDIVKVRIFPWRESALFRKYNG